MADATYTPGVSRQSNGNKLVIRTDDDGTLDLNDAGCIVFCYAGTPTDGGAGTGLNVAAKGSLCIDTTNGVIYINTNTAASPTWAAVGDQEHG